MATKGVDMDNLIRIYLIDNYLKYNNISKTSFCLRCGISNSTLNKIYLYKNFNIKALFKIAKELNLPVCRLFF